MSYERPMILQGIPELDTIYEINEGQETEIKESLESLDDDLFGETMGEYQCSRWESILGLNHKEDDTLQERRFRIQAKLSERLPYTVNVLKRKLDALAQGEYELTVEPSKVSVKIALTSKRMKEDMTEILEEMVPLNQEIEVELKYNTWTMLHSHTWQSFETKTWAQLRNEVI